MKKVFVLLVLVLFISAGYSQEVIPSYKLNKYFKRELKKETPQKRLMTGLDCNSTVINGQQYSGIVGTPFVAFGFSSCYTLNGIISPPSMGLGYLFSYGIGTGLPNGNMSWNNTIGLGGCITTGFKPTSLSNIPTNIGVYVVWQKIGIGYYYDTSNKLWGISVGGSIALPTIGSSIYNIVCVK